MTVLVADSSRILHAAFGSFSPDQRFLPNGVTSPHKEADKSGQVYPNTIHVRCFSQILGKSTEAHPRDLTITRLKISSLD